ncbi:hypothetical protein [Solihabitans fulvus]|uniref:hypothetical protein n=1 Tax=Solihabitans fulvus TaxID=1892852 RepID=UPI001661A07C|nr:hypothetical protein [Solihabitans fulvus]
MTPKNTTQPAPPPVQTTTYSSDQRAQYMQQYQLYLAEHANQGLPGVVMSIGEYIQAMQKSQQYQDDQAKALESQVHDHRPPPSFQGTNYLSYDHPTLKSMVNTNIDPTQVDGQGRSWNKLGNTMVNFQNEVSTAVSSSTTHWQGTAGDSARNYLTGLGTWTGSTGQGAQLIGNHMAAQQEAAATAKTSMPEPVNFSMGDAMKMYFTSSPADLANTVTQINQKFDQQQQAHEQAAHVMSTMADSLKATSTTMPAFAPPPTMAGPGDGTGINPPNGVNPPGSGSGGVPGGGSGGGGGGGVPGGGGGVPGGGGGGMPGGPGGGYPGGGGGGGLPGGPGGGGGGGGYEGIYHGGGPGTGTSGAGGGGGGMPGGPGGGYPGGGYPMPGGPGTPGWGTPGGPGGGFPGGGFPGGMPGGGVPGGRGGGPGSGRFPGGSTGMPGSSGMPGGRGGGAGSGFGPGGSSGMPGSRGGAGSGFGPGGSNPSGGSAAGAMAAEEAAAARGGGMGAAGARGAAGGMGAGGMGAGKGGKGEDDKEHKSASYLVETEDVFGDGERVAPPVIGG